VARVPRTSVNCARTVRDPAIDHTLLHDEASVALGSHVIRLLTA